MYVAGKHLQSDYCQKNMERVGLTAEKARVIQRQKYKDWMEQILRSLKPTDHITLSKLAISR